jgi:DNA helicase-2/ATP-dependent DNA helicase PcrA
MVLPSLGESEVPTRTFRSFLQNLLPNYEIVQEEQQEEQFLTGANDRVEKLKNGLTLVQQIPRYVEGITPFGPLFRDLKIKGETYITKEQLRQWYQQTNDQLPLYQRTQLLQTKVLKKIGGLKKRHEKKCKRFLKMIPIWKIPKKKNVNCLTKSVVKSYVKNSVH